MRQRLGIAAALLQPRDLLLLDEPTNGLDPQGTREVRTLVAELARDGVTVFLSSHLLSEVEQLCTDVGVMSAGPAGLAGRPGPAAGAAGAAGAGRDRPGRPRPSACSAGSGWPRRAARADTASALLGDAEPERVVAALVHAGVGVRSFTVERASLEDQFVDLTGEGFDVSG